MKKFDFDFDSKLQEIATSVQEETQQKIENIYNENSEDPGIADIKAIKELINESITINVKLLKEYHNSLMSYLDFSQSHSS